MAIEHKEVAEIYFHISNGGINVEVLQREDSFEYDGETVTHKAPALRISAHHFGHKTNGMEFQLSPDALRLLGETLIRASELVKFDGDPLIVEDPRRVKVGGDVTELGPPLVAQGSSVQSVEGKEN